VVNSEKSNTMKFSIQLSNEELFDALYSPVMGYFSRKETEKESKRPFTTSIQIDVPSGLMFWALHGNQGPIEIQHMEACLVTITDAMSKTNKNSATHSGYMHLLTHIQALVLEHRLALRMKASLLDCERIPDMSPLELSHYPILQKIQEQQTETMHMDMRQVQEMASKIHTEHNPSLSPQSMSNAENFVESNMTPEVIKETEKLMNTWMSPFQLEQVRLYLKSSRILCPRLIQYDLKPDQCDNVVVGMVTFIGITCLLMMLAVGTRRLFQWRKPDRHVESTRSCDASKQNNRNNIDWDKVKAQYHGDDERIEIIKQFHSQSTIKMAILMQQELSPNNNNTNAIRKAITDPKVQASYSTATIDTMYNNLHQQSLLLKNILALKLPVGEKERNDLKTEQAICIQLCYVYGNPITGTTITGNPGSNHTFRYINEPKRRKKQMEEV
jgi:hypothetical protein